MKIYIIFFNKKFKKLLLFSFMCANIYLSEVLNKDKCRRVGMADEADSKSVVGNHVRVQVPLPAGNGAKSNHVGSGFAPFCVGKLEGKMNLLASVSVYVGERR